MSTVGHVSNHRVVQCTRVDIVQDDGSVVGSLASTQCRSKERGADELEVSITTSTSDRYPAPMNDSVGDGPVHVSQVAHAVMA